MCESRLDFGAKGVWVWMIHLGLECEMLFAKCQLEKLTKETHVMKRERDGNGEGLAGTNTHEAVKVYDWYFGPISIRCIGKYISPLR